MFAIPGFSIISWGARWLSGRVSDSGARGPGFETYLRRVVSLSKTLYSPKVLVNYPGSDGSVTEKLLTGTLSLNTTNHYFITRQHSLQCDLFCSQVNFSNVFKTTCGSVVDQNMIVITLVNVKAPEVTYNVLESAFFHTAAGRNAILAVIIMSV